MSSSTTAVEEFPAWLWVAIPSVCLIAAFYARRWYLLRKLRVHGIGKGAPGFQTNVRQIRVTPEIAARLRRGEHVSPEEIAQASSLAEQAEKRGDSVEKPAKGAPMAMEDPVPVNEWLPDTITKPKPKKRSKAKRS